MTNVELQKLLKKYPDNIIIYALHPDGDILELSSIREDEFCECNEKGNCKKNTKKQVLVMEA